MVHEYMISRFKKIKTFGGQDFSAFASIVFFVISAAFLLLASGCQTSVVNNPRIDYNAIDAGPKIPAEPQVIWKPPKVEVPSTYPKAWYPASGEKTWSAIIVHHSATETGNMALFDTQHRSLGWNGVGYDFVIGNGTDSTDGQIEVTYRWKQQEVGAHCKTSDNWANIDGIGICLVGNFNDTRPTAKQLDSLVKLTDFLQKRYSIPQSRIYGHGTTPGGHATDCPGKLFPMSKFKSLLSF